MRRPAPARLGNLLGWLRTCLRHPRVVRASLGATVQGPARVRKGLWLGRGTRVLRGLDCVGPVTIGEGSFVNVHCYLRPWVVIGDDVAIGPYVRLITDTHELGGPRRRALAARFEPVVVGDGAWIGASVVVLPGVTVGPGAVVAAGSVVHADVTPHTLVAGVPATVRRHLGNEPEV